MFFWRRAYDRLLEWKERSAGRTAVLLEGPGGVGKTTLARRFAQKEYETHILIDFFCAPQNVLDCFDDLDDLDMFFLRLQAVTGIRLIQGRSVLVFDNVQHFPRARQAIKYLVEDGRYHYIETCSLALIRRNYKNLLIPSEETKLPVRPLDYEEFMRAAGNDTYDLLGKALDRNLPGGAAHRKLMQDFCVYMAVGGMPRAVKAYIDKRSMAEIDEIKREIICSTEKELATACPGDKAKMMFRSIPSQMSSSGRRFVISRATGRKKLASDLKLVAQLAASGAVLVSYRCVDPAMAPLFLEDLEIFRLYLADTGLLVTLAGLKRPADENRLYEKLLCGRLPAELGYLYENAAAQMIASHGRKLYYHTWDRPGTTHYLGIDFLLYHGGRNIPVLVKASAIRSHAPLSFCRDRCAGRMGEGLIVSQKDLGQVDGFANLPIYLFPAYLDRLGQDRPVF